MPEPSYQATVTPAGQGSRTPHTEPRPNLPLPAAKSARCPAEPSPERAEHPAHRPTCRDGDRSAQGGRRHPLYFGRGFPPARGPRLPVPPARCPPPGRGQWFGPRRERGGALLGGGQSSWGLERGVAGWACPPEAHREAQGKSRSHSTMPRSTLVTARRGVFSKGCHGWTFEGMNAARSLLHFVLEKPLI